MKLDQVIGWKPSDDPKADELRNSNISAPKQGASFDVSNKKLEEENQNG